MTSILVWLIRAYGSALAPFFAPTCRFSPSCSRYAEQALQVHGARVGLSLAVRRLCRCRPFGGSGLDEVPALAAKAPRRAPGTQGWFRVWAMRRG